MTSIDFIKRAMHPVSKELDKTVSLNEFSLIDLIEMSNSIERVLGYILNVDEENEIPKDYLKTMFNFKYGIDHFINEELENFIGK